MEAKLGKGPAEVIRALSSGDPEQMREALEFQREAFRAQLGCYPEELVAVDMNEPDPPEWGGSCPDCGMH